MADENTRRVMVTVNDQERSIQSIAKSLRSKGMKVQEKDIASAIGVILGEVEESKIHALETVPGVIAVEQVNPMQAL